MEKAFTKIGEINLEDSKDFWNTDETKGYTNLKASDGRDYKVWIGDPSEKSQRKWWYNPPNNDVADTLARVRSDLLKLLNYINDNPQLWIQNPIAFGIYHTLDLHLNDKVPYMEMRPNTWGGLGLNKPKRITIIKTDVDTKPINYELGTKRVILLTIRNQQTGEIRNYKDIMDLAIHELTHTTTNDVRWIPEYKGGNHREPYPTYHKFMRKCAKDCGILN